MRQKLEVRAERDKNPTGETNTCETKTHLLCGWSRISGRLDVWLYGCMPVCMAMWLSVLFGCI